MPVVGRRSERTELNYQSALRTFRSFAGDKAEYTKEEIAKAISKMERKYRPGYCGYVFRVCQTSIKGWPREIGYKYSQADVKKVLLSEENLGKMMDFVLSCEYPNPRAYLLISTLYCPRRVELTRIIPPDVDLSQRTIFIRTGKSGIQRHHLIPASVVKLLVDASFAPVSLSTMTSVYRWIEANAGVEHVTDCGWHAIRRALATSFAKLKVDPVSASKFFRWRQQSMYENYVSMDFRAADEEVFKVHPFLKMWEERL